MNHYNNIYNNINLKQQLVKYIFNTVDLSNYKYKLLEYENDLDTFDKSKEYYASANFTGTNCLLVFCKLRDKFYSFLLDRKLLSFNINQIDYERVILTPVNVKVDSSIYNGTIFDGIIIRNDKIRDKFYVITDVYYFRGSNMTNDKITHKFMNVSAYLDNNLKQEKYSNLNLTVNKLYPLEEISVLINEDIPKTKGFHIRGLSFYPEISGTKLIYVFPQNQKIVCPTKSEQANASHDETEKKKKTTKYINKTSKTVTGIFELRKTNVSDVYKLFLVEDDISDGKKILKSKKMGIAYVPSLECSQLCKDTFSKLITERALFKCKFDNDKSKWIPIEHCTDRKIPSKITEIEEHLETIEVSDEEE